jgi:hypothetical protein
LPSLKKVKLSPKMYHHQTLKYQVIWSADTFRSKSCKLLLEGEHKVRSSNMLVYVTMNSYCRCKIAMDMLSPIKWQHKTSITYTLYTEKIWRFMTRKNKRTNWLETTFQFLVSWHQFESNEWRNTWSISFFEQNLSSASFFFT